MCHPDQKKGNVFHAILEVNSIVGEVWVIMDQSDDKEQNLVCYLTKV